LATVLVVDDRKLDRELLVTLLQYARHRVIEAANGAEALRLVGLERPDLVISDVLLPEMDGYGLVRRMRDDATITQPAVIFYTAVFNEQEARELALECGVARILSKPTEPEEILRVVAAVLKSRGIEDASPVPHDFVVKHQRLLIDKLIEQVDALQRSEERFRRAHDELEVRVKERTAELAGTNEALYRREREVRALVENSPDVISRLDSSLRYLYVNPKIEQLTWIPPHSLLGKTAKELGYSEELLSSFEEVCRKVFETGEVRGFEFDFAVPDGKIKHLESRIVPEFARDGSVESIMVVTRDVTKRKQAEHELESYMQRLELLNEELQDFTFAASHDLQEPLRKIQTFASQISSKHAANLDDEGRDFLQRMQRTANRMSSLLEALHRYAQSTTSPVTFTPTDLTILAKEAVLDIEDKIQESEASVEIGKLPTAYVDLPQFRLLFRHLIGNGINYAGDKKPRVKVFGEKLDNGDCRIYVQDNGIGFEEQHLRKIFAPFQRLHGRNSPYEGIGMGLAICRKIVERHSGAITARSAPGDGTTFIVTLPASHHSEHEHCPAGAARL